MNIIDAAHSTVRSYPGGSESLGPRIGMSAAVLRNKVNPNNTTHHLTVAEASEIMGVTGDHRMLQAMAAEHGYVLASVDLGAGETSVLQTLLRANAAEGEFDRVLGEALADNLITANEMKAIAEAGVAQQSATMILLAKLRAVSEGRAQG
ncbi:phage regulatory CII family protein [Lysobacter sp. F6437]|uniref:phage regulatory CII family protein n=1 Tax=Lysobacter sp. F6437 TaxID=3459296 RepID=UPI00403D5DA6